MNLEQLVLEESVGTDSEFDRIIPYNNYGVPILEFAESGGNSPLPEFYEEYPIFVEDEEFKRSELAEQFNPVFRRFASMTEIDKPIQVIPLSSIHNSKAEIMRVNVYTYSRQLVAVFDNNTTDFYFNMELGTLSFSDTSRDILEPYVSGGITLEFCFEKFRSILDLRELTAEQVENIRAMQIAHAETLNYLYQFQVAQDTESNLQEVAYTILITITSTIATLGISYGVGKLAGKVGERLSSMFSGLNMKGVLAPELLKKPPNIAAYILNNFLATILDTYKAILFRIGLEDYKTFRGVLLEILHNYDGKSKENANYLLNCD